MIPLIGGNLIFQCEGGEMDNNALGSADDEAHVSLSIKVAGATLRKAIKSYHANLNKGEMRTDFIGRRCWE